MGNAVPGACNDCPTGEGESWPVAFNTESRQEPQTEMPVETYHPRAPTTATTAACTQRARAWNRRRSASSISVTCSGVSTVNQQYLRHAQQIEAQVQAKVVTPKLQRTHQRKPPDKPRGRRRARRVSGKKISMASKRGSAPGNRDPPGGQMAPDQIEGPRPRSPTKEQNKVHVAFHYRSATRTARRANRLCALC